MIETRPGLSWRSMVRDACEVADGAYVISLHRVEVQYITKWTCVVDLPEAHLHGYSAFDCPLHFALATVAARTLVA